MANTTRVRRAHGLPAITFAAATVNMVSALHAPAFAAGADASALEEVVVTATRQSSSVNRVPLAVTAETQRDLDQRGVLTIAEADPDGRSQAMFSLLFRPGALNFRLNIDAVSRSGLKVDPRVLRLAQGG